MSAPNANYGRATNMEAEGNPTLPGNMEMSYLKIDLTGVTSLTKAVLWVYVSKVANTTSRYHVHVGKSSSWSEATLDFNNAPHIYHALGHTTYVSAGTWVPFDVTKAVGLGELKLGQVNTFALMAAQVQPIDFGTREGGKAAYLVVTT